MKAIRNVCSKSRKAVVRCLPVRGRARTSFVAFQTETGQTRYVEVTDKGERRAL